ncbi:AGAP006378-PA [Anopheles gambiae str. PEST]|uniref:AGAP006378-PA n=1 Tax=Anopheles gambiae TaxID=7165 RepID=A7UU89_ANOGA|nr:AGAP006378-PA [Anopheles gambiae str. PEST]
MSSSLKERSSSSVREKFINDPAYTEDVRHLALPMRRNSGPEHDPGRKFYMISKKKSNSVGKDYSRGSLQLGGGGGGASGSSEFYTLDVESIRRAGLNVPEVKPRRKKYNHHSSAELLNRLLNTDESSSSDGVPSKGHSSTLDRGRGRSLDRRSYTTSEERTAVRGLSISRTAGDEDIPLGRDGGRQQQQQQQRSRKTRTVSSRRENSDQDVEPVELSAASGLPPGDACSEDVMVKGATDPREGGSSKGGGRFQIGKRFLKGEIGIKSFNYYLLKEGLKSSKKSLLKQRSAPVVAASATVGSVDIPLPEPPQAMELISPEECEDAPGARMVEKGEENIYEEIYFEDKPKCPPEEYHSKEVSAQRPECPDANSEKIQFIDCELCVQQCSNANCDIYQRQKQLLQDQQKQSKQSIDGHARSMGNLVDEPSMYASENVLQYQSYNPSNPNVYKLETTPVAFSSDYSPLQQIYYKQQQQQQQLSAPPSQGDTLPANPRQHIYQRPHQPGGAVSSGSDYYQELNHKKSSSSSDSLQQQQRRLQSNTGIYYQRAAAALSDDQHRSLMSSGAGSKIYKVNSTVSILSEASGRSEGSYHHQQQMAPQIQPQYQPLSVVMKTAPHDHPSTQSGPQARPQQSQQQQQQQQPYGRTGGNMSDSSLGDSLFSYPANRRYFGSSESCRFASESCRRCSVEVDKCSFSDTCRYSDCRNCDCSSSYFSSDFDDTGHGGMRGGKKGSHLTHTQSEAAGYYQAPPYAEDFMKHIYETPPTYVGMMPITGSGLQKPREPTYETLRNPPYSIPMVGPSYEATPLVASGRLSISQSHEALISPVRRSRSSRSTDTDQYPQLERRSPVSHYSKIRRPHQSNTLPSSMRSARRHQQQGGGEYDPAGYSVIREGPPNTRAATPGPSGGSTLPKSFSLQQARTTPMVSGRSASLLTMGHEYAEITKASARTKPIPPPISTIPSTREARARSKQAATANVRAVSPSQYARTGPSGIAGSSAGNYASMERKSRDRSTKQGKSSDTAGKDRSPVQREQQLEQKGKANRETGVASSAAGGSASLTRSGMPTTGSTRRKEFVRSQQQQHRSKRPVQDDLTDDEDDDEVFLNDKLYERPVQNNRGHSGKDQLQYLI